LDVIGTKNFPPCYSQSPLLTDPPALSKSGLKLVCNVNIACTYTETSSLKTLKIMPRNLDVHEFGFRSRTGPP
jgi:hypothetical protein